MITALPDPSGRAGIAQLRVTGAAAAAPGALLRIRREGWDHGILGPNGWQGEDALLQPDQAEAEGGDLVMLVGWDVCSHLEAGTYMIAVPQAGIDEAVSWPDIRPVRATARPRPAPAVAPPPLAPPVTPPPVAPPAAALPPAVPPPLPATARPIVPPPLPPPLPVRSGRRTGLLLGLLLLTALAAAGGGYWYWQNQSRTQVAVVTPPTPTTAPVRPPDIGRPIPPTPPTPPARALSDMNVPDVLKNAPNVGAITAEGQRRLAGRQPDDGMLLLEEAADRGDGNAMAALAKLYDPVGFQPGPVLSKPDPRQAARYYRDASRAGVPGVDARREALRSWLQNKANGGDVPSQLVLRDFWP